MSRLPRYNLMNRFGAGAEIIGACRDCSSIRVTDFMVPQNAAILKARLEIPAIPCNSRHGSDALLGHSFMEAGFRPAAEFCPHVPAEH